MRYILLDTNIIIGAFDSTDKSNPQHQNAKQIIRELMKQDDVKFAITPLIRYEVLRGLTHKSVSEMQEILNDFENFEITEEIAVKSAEVFYKIPKPTELDELQKKNYKHNFDIFHCVVATTLDLELRSNDMFIQKIKEFAEKI